MVCAVKAAGVTWKLCTTAVAAANWALPACDAVIEQVPVVTSVTVEPETEQTGVVVEAKATGICEEAVAVSETVPDPSTFDPGPVNEMVCEAGVTWKLCDTAVAAA